MTVAWSPAQRIHAVQFYEGERFLHRAIARFFSEALQRREPTVMIARRNTFEGVAAHLADIRAVSAVEAAGHIKFVDAETACGEFMDGIRPDAMRFERGFMQLLTEVQRGREDGMVWLYGEMVDLLCKAGNHAAAVQLEDLWNFQFASHRVSVMCGYAMEDFADDVNAGYLRTICRQHTHVIPAESFTDAPDDRTRFEQVALLQQRARALDRELEDEPYAPAAAAALTTTATVHIIDDDAGVRRSLARLFASVDLPVETFASAENFLASVDRTSIGCVIVDVQLDGLSGLDILSRIAGTHGHMPVIVMSGSDDLQIEMKALRLGAVTFLRKPFDAETLLDALARALSRN